MPESQVPAYEYSFKQSYWDVRSHVCIYMVTKQRSSPRERPGIVYGVTWLQVGKYSPENRRNN